MNTQPIPHKESSDRQRALLRLTSVLLVATAVLALLMVIIAASNSVSDWWGGGDITTVAALTAAFATLAFASLLSLRRKLRPHEQHLNSH